MNKTGQILSITRLYNANRGIICLYVNRNKINTLWLLYKY